MATCAVSIGLPFEIEGLGLLFFSLDNFRNFFLTRGTSSVRYTMLGVLSRRSPLEIPVIVICLVEILMIHLCLHWSGSFYKGLPHQAVHSVSFLISLERQPDIHIPIGIWDRINLTIFSQRPYHTSFIDGVVWCVFLYRNWYCLVVSHYD